jgi:hypothetical protein
MSATSEHSQIYLSRPPGIRSKRDNPCSHLHANKMMLPLKQREQLERTFWVRKAFADICFV